MENLTCESCGSKWIGYLSDWRGCWCKKCMNEVEIEPNKCEYLKCEKLTKRYEYEYYRYFCEKHLSIVKSLSEKYEDFNFLDNDSTNSFFTLNEEHRQLQLLYIDSLLRKVIYSDLIGIIVDFLGGE